MPSAAIVIAPPVRGNWVIYNPPGHPKLAFDFLAEDAHQSLYGKGSFINHLVSFISVEDTLTWSRAIVSPVDGVVIQSHDGERDRTRISFLYDLIALLINKPKVGDGFGAFGGNYVLLRSNNFFVLLCHLKQGSLKVKAGDKVSTGQQLAQAGNSGSSIQPHLHIQVMSSDQIFPLFNNLLPFKISQGRVKRDDSWLWQEGIEPNNRAHYHFE